MLETSDFVHGSASSCDECHENVGRSKLLGTPLHQRVLGRHCAMGLLCITLRCVSPLDRLWLAIWPCLVGVDTHVLSNADFVNKFGTALALRTCHSYERLNALKAYRYVTQALPVTSPVCRYSVVLKVTRCNTWVLAFKWWLFCDKTYW